MSSSSSGTSRRRCLLSRRLCQAELRQNVQWQVCDRRIVNALHSCLCSELCQPNPMACAVQHSACASAKSPALPACISSVPCNPLTIKPRYRGGAAKLMRVA